MPEKTTKGSTDKDRSPGPSPPHKPSPLSPPLRPPALHSNSFSSKAALHQSEPSHAQKILLPGTPHPKSQIIDLSSDPDLLQAADEGELLQSRESQYCEDMRLHGHSSLLPLDENERESLEFAPRRSIDPAFLKDRWNRSLMFRGGHFDWGGSTGEDEDRKTKKSDQGRVSFEGFQEKKIVPQNRYSDSIFRDHEIYRESREQGEKKREESKREEYTLPSHQPLLVSSPASTFYDETMREKTDAPSTENGENVGEKGRIGEGGEEGKERKRCSLDAYLAKLNLSVEIMQSPPERMLFAQTLSEENILLTDFFVVDSSPCEIRLTEKHLELWRSFRFSPYPMMLLRHCVSDLRTVESVFDEGGGGQLRFLDERGSVMWNLRKGGEKEGGERKGRGGGWERDNEFVRVWMNACGKEYFSMGWNCRILTRGLEVTLSNVSIPHSFFFWLCYEDRGRWLRKQLQFVLRHSTEEFFLPIPMERKGEKETRGRRREEKGEKEERGRRREEKGEKEEREGEMSHFFVRATVMNEESESLECLFSYKLNGKKFLGSVIVKNFVFNESSEETAPERRELGREEREAETRGRGGSRRGEVDESNIDTEEDNGQSLQESLDANTLSLVQGLMEKKRGEKVPLKGILKNRQEQREETEEREEREERRRRHDSSSSEDEREKRKNREKREERQKERGGRRGEETGQVSTEERVQGANYYDGSASIFDEDNLHLYNFDDPKEREYLIKKTGEKIYQKIEKKITATFGDVIIKCLENKCQKMQDENLLDSSNFDETSLKNIIKKIISKKKNIIDTVVRTTAENEVTKMHKKYLSQKEAQK